MEIFIKELENNTIVLELDGEIDIYSSTEVKDTIINQIDFGAKNIIVDLENVNYIDSSGIGAFISALAVIKKINGKMVIIKVTEAVRKVFELTKLTNFFKIYKDEESAIKALSE